MVGVERFEFLGLGDLVGAPYLGEGGKDHRPVVPPLGDRAQQVVIKGLELVGVLVLVALEEQEARFRNSECLLPDAALAHRERRLSAFKRLDCDRPLLQRVLQRLQKTTSRIMFLRRGLYDASVHASTEGGLAHDAARDGPPLGERLVRRGRGPARRAFWRPDEQGAGQLPY